MKKLVGLVISSLIFLFIIAACNTGIVIISVSGIELSEGTLTPAFDSEVTTYAATVSNATDSVDVTVTVESEVDLTVSINETDVIPGVGTATVPLSVGENVVTILVSYEGDSETYTITVTRAGSPEIKLIGPTTFGGLDEDLTSGTIIDFGATSGSVEITFTIENAGTADLNLTGSPPDYISVTGTDQEDFVISLSPVEAVIPPNGSQQFKIRFDYDGNDGTKNATATIESDDDDESSFTLSLTGVANSGA